MVLKNCFYSVIVVLLFNCYLVKSTSNRKNNKENYCKRCKVLTDSIDYWLKKTSRGNFEGGDAAWEESKLKAYARSEIRLVEIQEGLCSEVKINQDICYTLAEENEQIIEKWWSQNELDNDIYSWLCIDMLKYCCPENNFGLNCERCPLSPYNNIICGGHGKCDGDSTRQGTGRCICDKGFAGTYCERCAKNFYRLSSDECNPCHTTCNECRGEGVNNCISCKLGWTMDDTKCVDIDECLDTHSCKSNQYCINNEGSFTCRMCDKSCGTCYGAGPYKCTSCKSFGHWFLWGGICLDDRMKSSFFLVSLKRAGVYSSIFVVLGIIYNISKGFAVVAGILTSVLIYYSELPLTMSTKNVLYNQYLP